MSQFPPHFPLGRKSPFDADIIEKVVFTITLGVKDGAVSLTLEGNDGSDYIAISEDSVVEIILGGDQLFFSKAHDAVSMKGTNLEHFYGQLEYGLYDKQLDRYKSVTFHARFNKGGKHDTTHGFNVNVDLFQPGGSSPRFIGISIDPDIKNPPPNRS